MKTLCCAPSKGKGKKSSAREGWLLGKREGDNAPLRKEGKHSRFLAAKKKGRGEEDKDLA